MKETTIYLNDGYTVRIERYNDVMKLSFKYNHDRLVAIAHIHMKDFKMATAKMHIGNNTNIESERLDYPTFIVGLERFELTPNHLTHAFDEAFKFYFSFNNLNDYYISADFKRLDNIAIKYSSFSYIDVSENVRADWFC